MTQFPGFPSNDFDFHFEEAGGALAGLLARTTAGDVIPGVLANRESILSAGDAWSIRVAPFVAARSKGRSVLLGGSTENVSIDVPAAPAANSRIDVVYTLPADVGAGDPPVAVAVASGVPGAVPSRPSLPVGAIELGTVTSRAGQSSAAQATIVETFPFAALHGGPLKVRSRAGLSALNVIDGSRAYIIDEGRTAERVLGEWVASKTVQFVAPFKTYVAGAAVNVDIEDGMVTISGTASTSEPDQIKGVTDRLMANVGDKFGPARTRIVPMQGSSTDRWTLTVLSNGSVSCARYGPGSPTASVWLPFSITYPLKRR